MKELISESDLQAEIEDHSAVIAYFSHENCNVCKVLKPKLEEYISTRFPKFQMIYINVEKLPQTAAQLSVFTVPVVLVFFEGRESLRKSRNFGIAELATQIERPYSLLFND